MSNIATLWTFGDSMTDRFSQDQIWAKQYVEWKGYTPKVYGDIISEMLGYDLQNMAKAGSDNYTIFETFQKTYPLIKDNDLVIIGWSNVDRFRIVNKFNEWITLTPNFDNYLEDFEYLSKNTIEEIFVNRTNSKYVDEVNGWIDFINHIGAIKQIFHWSTIKGEGELNTHHFFEMQRISTETIGVIKDEHFSEQGHEHLSKVLLNEILAYKEKLLRPNKLI